MNNNIYILAKWQPREAELESICFSRAYPRMKNI